MNIFYTPIEALKPKLNTRLISALHKLGINNLSHLLLYPPKKFINYTHCHTISQIYNIPSGNPIVLEVTIINKKQTRLRGRQLTLGEITITKSIGFNLWKGNNLYSNSEGNEYLYDNEMIEKIKKIKPNNRYEILKDKLYKKEAIKNILSDPFFYFIYIHII